MIDRIGPFQIESELGRGGMGVVYLARDTRLDRRVAIKSLPTELASDPARLERFEREARTLATLNHANVAGIYGVEEKDGARYLVLELVEGETLAERLDRDPLPLDDAIDIARGVATGVEAAHASGIIHRDLKPANIKITPDGVAKVLDFGLARTDESGASSSGGGLDSPTLTTPQPQHSPTIAGAILGTAAYMSPEQARGRRVDTRTDIWSFGVVLYEMLVGSGPFHGETATDSIGAILHKDLDLERLPAGTPNPVVRLIRRCLERDRNRRLQSIGDARVELEEIAESLESGSYRHDTPAERPGSGVLWPAIAGVLVVALIGTLIWNYVPTQRASIQIGATLPEIESVRRLTNFAEIEQHPTLSPDGRSVVYAASEGGDADIFLLRIGGSNPINLTEDSPHDDFDPAFSPDGEQIAFASTRGEGGVFVMGATGENPRRVAAEGFDPAWSPDGTKLVCTTDLADNPYGRPAYGQLFTVDLASGAITRITTEPAGPADSSAEHDAVGPSWSPDGHRIVYWSVEGGQRDLFWVGAKGGPRTRLTNDAATDWDPVWTHDGRSIIFLSDRGGVRGLWRLALTDDWRAQGEPTPIMPSPINVAEFALAPSSNALVIRTVSEESSVEGVGFDTGTLAFGGEPRLLHAGSGGIYDMDVSPDGEFIAYRSAGAIGDDIVVAATDGSFRRTILQDEFRDRGPRFSEDPSFITYFSNRTGEYSIWTSHRSGMDPRILVKRDDTGLGVPCWTRDFRMLATHGMSPRRTLVFRTDDEGEVIDDPIVIDDLVNPIQWSLDGAKLLGLHERQDGLLSVAAYDMNDGTFTFVQQPNGRYIDSGAIEAWLAWIDATRVVGWSVSENRAYICDLESGESDWIVSPFRDRVDFIKFINGTLYYVRNAVSGDLWLLELAEPPRTPN